LRREEGGHAGNGQQSLGEGDDDEESGDEELEYFE